MEVDWKNARFLPLPLAEMTHDEKVEELYECLTRLWGGGGEWGAYTIAVERERLHVLLQDLLGGQQ